ncbi:recombinase family protein [Escherichia coli]|uniref:recombinase family protein n=1 Tax=Escherichia coli TaxID=562 RepID=UPI0038901624
MTQTVPKGFVRAYLRASTSEQDASRALAAIDSFAEERGLNICNYYIENELVRGLTGLNYSGCSSDCRHNDILLIEDVDRLSRLTGEDWNSLKN